MRGVLSGTYHSLHKKAARISPRRPFAIRIEPPQSPLCRCCLLLHRLQNLLADVDADLHGERDHDGVANLRPSCLIRCLFLHLRGELRRVLLDDGYARLEEVRKELLLRLLDDVERALLHRIKRAVSDFCPLTHNHSSFPIPTFAYTYCPPRQKHSNACQSAMTPRLHRVLLPS